MKKRPGITFFVDLVQYEVCRLLNWETVFKYAATLAWNQLQSYLKHQVHVSLEAFKATLNDLEACTSG